MRPLLLLTLLAACADDGGEDGHDDHAEGVLHAISVGDLFHVEVAPTPWPATTGGDTTFEVLVEAMPDNEAELGATVTVNPWMPTMDHGIAGPYAADELGDGLYETAFQFTMPGAWELQVHVEGVAGEDDATLELEVE